MRIDLRLSLGKATQNYDVRRLQQSPKNGPQRKALIMMV